MIALLALLALTSPELEVLARYQCVRCHDVPDVAPAATERGCLRCHRAILDGSLGAQLGHDVDPAALAAWRSRIVHFIDVPSLVGLDRRVRRSWIEAFLLHPHDVRPALAETMPRLPITVDDAGAIAAALVPHQPDEKPDAWSTRAAPASAELAAGRALLDSKGCTACHRFTGVPPLRAVPDASTEAGRDLGRAVRLAPDLRHARIRLTQRSLLAWLKDPRALKRDSAMPQIPLSDDERSAIARYLLEAPLDAGDARDASGLGDPALAGGGLPLLARRVAWDEVNQRVFQRSCRHCHADPGLAFGDGGPGNTGGLGYLGRGLSLASYQETTAGSLDDDGDGRSIFAPLGPGPMAGVPRLVAHLRARRLEEDGVIVPGILGMPLALPALADDELQLIESWIAQGRPR